MKKVSLIAVALVVSLAYCGWTMAQDAVKPAPAAQVQDAQAAAQAWLALVDQGQYEQSYENASAYFKSMIDKEKWASQLAAVRKPLGTLVSRNLTNKQDMTSLPGMPDGAYCVLSFATVLNNKASAVETMTVMKEKDGQWRMAGYFIR